ncbi:MAG: acryloyl-CoA reductase [Vulcanimicrobiaceae bacterium]
MSTLPEKFRALVVDQRDGKTAAEVVERGASSLVDEGVVVEVHRAALNYKDGLAITGKGKILRSHPMIPGVEMSGRVIGSRDARWPVGSAVLVGGWGVGERYSGTYTEYFAAKPDWLEPLPPGYDDDAAMTLGIAGITAMQCIVRLRDMGLRNDAPVLVTGAGGGVGSVAVKLLAGLGYDVAASTGRPELEPYLRSLGATSIVPRADLSGQIKPLGSERWAGAIDTVGGAVLAGLIPELKYGASVAAVGLTAGAELHTTVFPFILRAANLLGIDSVRVPLEHRATLWREMAEVIKPADLAGMREYTTLAGLPDRAQAIVAGQIRGRTVVKIR